MVSIVQTTMFVSLLSFLAVGLAPLHRHGIANVHVRKTNTLLPSFCSFDEECEWPQLCMCEIMGVGYCCAGIMIPIPIPIPPSPVPEP